MATCYFCGITKKALVSRCHLSVTNLGWPDSGDIWTERIHLCADCWQDSDVLAVLASTSRTATL